MFPFPTNRMIIPASLIAVATLASLIAYLLLRPSREPVHALPCEVLQAGSLPPVGTTSLDKQDALDYLQRGPLPPVGTTFFGVSGFEVKVLDSDTRLQRFWKDVTEPPRMATVQWRCNITNMWHSALRYIMQAELLDKDGFVIITRTVDGDDGQGDLLAGRTHTIHDDVVVEYSRTRSWASCRITIKALETSEQIASRAKRLERVAAQNMREIFVREGRPLNRLEQVLARRNALEQVVREDSEERARAAKEQQRKLIDLERAKATAKIEH
jgi:hypothetical protein